MKRRRSKHGRSQLEQLVGDALGRVARRARFAEVAFALVTLGAAVLAYITAVVMIDQAIDGGLPLAIRRIIFALSAGAGALACWKLLLQPLGEVFSDQYLARLIERRHPEMHNSLITSLDLANGQQVNDGVVHGVLDRAVRDLSALPVDESVPMPHVHRGLRVMWSVIGVFIVYSFIAPKEVWPTVKRALGMNVAAPTATLIEWITPTDDISVTRGTPIEFAARIERRVPRSAVVQISLDGGKSWHSGRDIPMMRTTLVGGEVRWTASHSAAEVQDSMLCRIAAGDALSQPRYIEVRPTPIVSAVRVRYDFPDYIGLPTETRGTPDIDAPVGTRVTVLVECNVAASNGTIRVEDVNGSVARNLVVDPAHPTRMTSTWLVERDAEYRIHVRDEYGTPNEHPIRHLQHARVDTPPQIAIESPADELLVAANDTVTVTAQIDDDYAIAGATVEYENGNTAGEIDLLGLSTAPATSRPASRRHLNASAVIDIGEIVTKPGTVVRWRIVAQDNHHDLRGSRAAQSTATSWRTIRIDKPKSSAADQLADAGRRNEPRVAPPSDADPQMNRDESDQSGDSANADEPAQPADATDDSANRNKPGDNSDRDDTTPRDDGNRGDGKNDSSGDSDPQRTDALPGGDGETERDPLDEFLRDNDKEIKRLKEALEDGMKGNDPQRAEQNADGSSKPAESDSAGRREPDSADGGNKNDDMSGPADGTEKAKPDDTANGDEPATPPSDKPKNAEDESPTGGDKPANNAGDTPAPKEGEQAPPSDANQNNNEKKPDESGDAAQPPPQDDANSGEAADQPQKSDERGNAPTDPSKTEVNEPADQQNGGQNPPKPGDPDSGTEPGAEKDTSEGAKPDSKPGDAPGKGKQPGEGNEAGKSDSGSKSGSESEGGESGNKPSDKPGDEGGNSDAGGDNAGSGSGDGKTGQPSDSKGSGDSSARAGEGGNGQPGGAADTAGPGEHKPENGDGKHTPGEGPGGAGGEIEKREKPFETDKPVEAPTGNTERLAADAESTARLVDELERRMREGKLDEGLFKDLGWDRAAAENFIRSFRRSLAESRIRFARSRQAGEQTADARNRMLGDTNMNMGGDGDGTVRGNSERRHNADADQRRLTEAELETVPPELRELLEAYYREMAERQ